MTTYLAQAFDVRGAWLDTDARGEGYASEVDGAAALLAFLNSASHGVAHDWDAGTHKRRPVAYWLVAVGGTVREAYLTSHGERYGVTVPEQGPGCCKPRSIPS